MADVEHPIGSFTSINLTDGSNFYGPYKQNSLGNPLE